MEIKVNECEQGMNHLSNVTRGTWIKYSKDNWVPMGEKGAMAGKVEEDKKTEDDTKPDKSIIC